MPPPEKAGKLKPDMPADALWVFDGDPFVGNRRIVAKAETAGELGGALANALVRRPTPHQLNLIRAAAQRSRCGDDAVANMQLVIAGLSRVHALQARDMLQPGGDSLAKYPGQPRVPAGNGRESGWWTNGREGSPSVSDHATPSSLIQPIANAGDPRNNKMARDAARAAGLDKDQQQELHRAISGQDFKYQEILEIAKKIAAGTF